MKFWRNIAYLLRFVGTLTLAGGLAGLLGMLLSYFLFEVQHLAFGYSYHSVISGETYLEGVRQSSALRRVAALAVCGLVAGGGWFLLFRYGRRLVSIPGAVGDSRLRMPPMETASNAFLQIATIGIGSPLGKEGAPREIGALFAGFAARWARLNSEHTRLVIAAGAGAGLAAVYNAPIGGAFFALGIMTGRIKASMPARWIAAFTVSILATLVARWGLGDVHQYAVPGQAKVTLGLIWWAVLAGPPLAIAAHYFVRLANSGRSNGPKNLSILPLCMAVFVLLGAALVFLPELAGNGRIAAQMGFAGTASLSFIALLLPCKIFFEWAALRAGAKGGLLTPSLANGAMLAVLLGHLWTLAVPESMGGTFGGAFALVGGTGFLAVSTGMPFMALALVMDMTQVDASFLLPMALCAASAWATRHFLFMPAGRLPTVKKPGRAKNRSRRRKRQTTRRAKN